MVFSDYIKQRILFFYSLLGYRPSRIALFLAREGIIVSKTGVAKFIARYLATGSIVRQPGSGRKTVISPEIKRIVEDQMRADDETTASQLHVILTRLGYKLSLRTILRCRTLLGWTFRGSAYCQLIRNANKVKRLEWARLHEGDRFEDAIFTDESSIQLESHRRFCCRKQGEPPKNKPRWVCLYQASHALHNEMLWSTLGQNTLSKYMCGEVLASEEELGFVFLRE